MQFIRAVYSPHAHPVYLAFRHHTYGVEDILALRDDYLDWKFGHLQRSERAEEVYGGDGETSLVGAWAMDPLSVWGKPNPI